MEGKLSIDKGKLKDGLSQVNQGVSSLFGKLKSKLKKEEPSMGDASQSVHSNMGDILVNEVVPHANAPAEGLFEIGGLLGDDNDGFQASDQAPFLFNREEHGPPIVHVAVVGFHHTLGPTLEYIYPSPHGSFEVDDETPPPSPGPVGEWRALLPFMALPDGTHNEEEDHVFFQLPYNKNGGGQLYGVACFQQVDTSKLPTDRSHTRSKVQKSVVVLSRIPFFGAIHARLQAVTRTFFSQNDFTAKRILQEAYDMFNALEYEKLDHSQLYLNLEPVGLLTKLRELFMVVFKALLLERRVMIYAPHPAAAASTAVVSLVSLLPGALEQNLGENFPGLGKKWFRRSRFGLPLKIFNNKCTCQPYVSLEQLELLERPAFDGYLVGVSNLMFPRHPRSRVELLVDFSSGQIEFMNSELKSVCAPGKLDKAFMKELLKTVDSTADGEVGWEGSDDWLRAQFETYIENLLTSAAGAVLSEKKDPSGGEKTKLLDESPESKETMSSLQDKYNSKWVLEWTKSNNYRQWLSRKGPSVAGNNSQRAPPKDGKHKYTFLNGDIYEGEFANHKRDGRGVYTSVNKDVYDGEWKNDVREGQGTFRSQAGRFTYEGQWLNDVRCGHGKAVFANQDTYEGKWKENKPHGQGIYRSANGTEYEGEFRLGVKCGMGQESVPNRESYKGEFQEDKRSGLGQCTYIDNSIYNGTWHEGKRTGMGTITSADGSRYEGEWLNDKRNGYGTWTRSNGDVYEGDFEDDDMVPGHWSVLYHSGDKYVGDLSSEGKRHGNGMCKYTSHDTYDGQWVDDQRSGEGNMYYCDGSRYEGEWKADLRHGYGKDYTPGGEVHEGWYSRGEKAERKSSTSDVQGTALFDVTAKQTFGLSKTPKEELVDLMPADTPEQPDVVAEGTRTSIVPDTPHSEIMFSSSQVDAGRLSKVSQGTLLGAVPTPRDSFSEWVEEFNSSSADKNTPHDSDVPESESTVESTDVNPRPLSAPARSSNAAAPAMAGPDEVDSWLNSLLTQPLAAGSSAGTAQKASEGGASDSVPSSHAVEKMVSSVQQANEGDAEVVSAPMSQEVGLAGSAENTMNEMEDDNLISF